MSNNSNMLFHLSDAQTVLLFAFIGGFIDAAGYLKLKGVFTSSITGNLVVACASVTKLEGVICRALCSISFAFGAFLSNLIATKLKLTYKMSGPIVASTLVGLEVIMFAVNWAVGSSLNADIDNSESLDSPSIIILSCLMGFAMGIQNGSLKEGFVNFPPTTVMTSTLVNVSAMLSQTMLNYLEFYGIINLVPAIDSSSVVTPKKVDAEANVAISSNEVSTQLQTDQNNKNTDALRVKCAESVSKLILLGRPLIAFLVGAVIGAVLMHSIAFTSMVVPLVISFAVVAEIILKYYTAPKPPLPAVAAVAATSSSPAATRT